MKQTALPLLGLVLLLSACEGKPDGAANSMSENAAMANVAAAADNGATDHGAQRPVPSDGLISAALAGAWASSDERPSDNPAERLCETDNFIHFERDGSYADYGERGRWHIENGVLILSATASLPDYGDENSTERPIDPPQIVRWPIIGFEDGVMALRVDGYAHWMFRCPDKSEG